MLGVSRMRLDTSSIVRQPLTTPRRAGTPERRSHNRHGNGPMIKGLNNRQGRQHTQLTYGTSRGDT